MIVRSSKGGQLVQKRLVQRTERCSARCGLHGSQQLHLRDGPGVCVAKDTYLPSLDESVLGD